jgi:5-methylcytosine-specific restriction protein A
MPRSEFSRQTRRDAYARSNGLCEAVGAVYGLEPSKRCSMPLDRGVEYDHYPLRAADGGGNGLDNCVAVCKDCHSFKTRTFDTPQAAKGKRVSDRHLGIKKPKQKIPSRPFGGWVPNIRYVDDDLNEEESIDASQ